MKFLRLLCSALLCCALLLGVSSVGVYGANWEELKVTVFSYFHDDAGVTRSFGTVEFFPNDGEITYKNEILTGSGTGRMDEVYTEYTITNKDGSVLFEGDEETRVKLENVTYRYLFMGTSVGAEYVYCPHEIIVEIEYTNGTIKEINPIVRNRSGSNGFDLEFTFTPAYDVQKISLLCTTAISDLDTIGSFSGAIKAECYLGEYGTDSGHVLTIEQPSEEAGLLKQLLSSIGDWFSQLFTKITNGFNNVIESIKELPNKILDGVKSLFVPEDGFFEAFMDELDQILEQSFGVIYQIGTYLVELWDGLVLADQTDTIEFPAVTIPLPDGNSFTFGGYTVKIVPDGFEFLATICKSLMGMCGTLLFVQGARKRYESIFGG